MAGPSKPPVSGGSLVATKYRLLGKIDEGSFGVICLGKDIDSRQQVAVKIESQQASQPQTLLEEARLLKALHRVGENDNVEGFPQVLWCGQEANKNILVMELLGANLDQLLLKMSGKFSLKTVLQLADQMIARIKFVHDNDYLHRDIKPENFLMGRRGKADKFQTTMRPLIISLVATTTLLCSFVSGVDVEHGAAFERVAECIYICTHADNADENLQVETVICDAHKTGYKCMTRPFDSSLDSSTEILDIYRAYMLELFFLANKANMCSPPLPYMELKELVDRSGIMQKKGLTSIENDEYVPCAGEINMNCYTAGVTDWKAHSSYFRIHLDHARCFERETPKCNFPIQRHINAVVQEFTKHLKVHETLEEL